MPPTDRSLNRDHGLQGDDALLRLVQTAQTGDRRAFEQIVGRFQADIFRMVYYRTRSQSDAEDLTQEIFMAAFKNLARLRESGRFKSWLFGIALNKVRDYHRQRRWRNLFSPLSVIQDPTDPEASLEGRSDTLQQLLKKEFWQHVETLLDSLSRMEREVFVLRFMDQFGIREIAAIMNKNESTVKTHLYRALKKFQRHQQLLTLLQEGTP